MDSKTASPSTTTMTDSPSTPVFNSQSQLYDRDDEKQEKQVIDLVSSPSQGGEDEDEDVGSIQETQSPCSPPPTQPSPSANVPTFSLETPAKKPTSSPNETTPQNADMWDSTPDSATAARVSEMNRAAAMCGNQLQFDAEFLDPFSTPAAKAENVAHSTPSSADKVMSGAAVPIRSPILLSSPASVARPSSSSSAMSSSPAASDDSVEKNDSKDQEEARRRFYASSCAAYIGSVVVEDPSIELAHYKLVLLTGDSPRLVLGAPPTRSETKDRYGREYLLLSSGDIEGDSYRTLTHRYAQASELFANFLVFLASVLSLRAWDPRKLKDAKNQTPKIYVPRQTTRRLQYTIAASYVPITTALKGLDVVEIPLINAHLLHHFVHVNSLFGVTMKLQEDAKSRLVYHKDGKFYTMISQREIKLTVSTPPIYRLSRAVTVNVFPKGSNSNRNCLPPLMLYAALISDGILGRAVCKDTGDEYVIFSNTTTDSEHLCFVSVDDVERAKKAKVITCFEDGLVLEVPMKARTILTRPVFVTYTGIILTIFADAVIDMRNINGETDQEGNPYGGCLTALQYLTKASVYQHGLRVDHLFDFSRIKTDDQPLDDTVVANVPPEVAHQVPLLCLAMAGLAMNDLEYSTTGKSVAKALEKKK